jgi:hypothetical protein
MVMNAKKNLNITVKVAIMDHLLRDCTRFIWIQNIVNIIVLLVFDITGRMVSSIPWI